MAAVDPYSECPCGSGQKYKWCCQKVEAYADRALRCLQNGQIDAAFGAIEEGLRKAPGNPLLLIRKSYCHLQLNQLELARAALRQILEHAPKHANALAMLTHLALESETPTDATAQFQQALSALPPQERAGLAKVTLRIGVEFGRSGFPAAALAHMALAAKLAGRNEPQGRDLIEKNPAVPLWLKNPDRLTVPEGLPEAARDRFAQAIAWADEGLWASAASAFELLTADRVASREAERNLGFCRLWMADNAGAAEAFRRAIAQLGTTTAAVDLEALAQRIAPRTPDDQVERVLLTWPLRNRDGLLARLRDDPTIDEDSEAPIDPDDPESPMSEIFLILDRPALNGATGIQAAAIPIVLGSLQVGPDFVALDSFDDGRLDGQVERFVALTDGMIVPAHPKTKVIDRVDKMSLALTLRWRPPDDVDPDELERLTAEQSARMINEVWPQTPMPFLNGKTPLEAAKAGNATVPLRAAILDMELSRPAKDDRVDIAGLRAKVNLEPEPPIDPDTVDLEQLHIARLALVPEERLNDDRLIILFRRARRFGLLTVLERVSRILVDRPDLWDRAEINALALFSTLAMLAADAERADDAFNWIRRGRQTESATERAAHAAVWDMIEIRARARTSPPEAWVPELAVVLERYQDPVHNQHVLSGLLELGLIEMHPNPDRSGGVILDDRILRRLLELYGPRVTTASGSLGVAAAKGELWTPDKGPAAAGGALWTPGSQPSAPAGEKPKSKLIIPGR